MNKLLGGAAMLLAVGVPGVLQAQGVREGTLLVLSKRDRTLSIVDLRSLEVLGRVPVGNDPHEVIASSDGRTAYVSNYGFGSYNTLAVVDLPRRAALAPIDLGPLRGPHGLAFVGGKTWFTAETAKAIGRYDPATGKVDFVLGTGQDRTHMIHVSADGQEIVTTNVSSGTVSMIYQEELRMRPPPPQGTRTGGPEGPVGRVGPGSPGSPGGPGGPGSGEGPGRPGPRTDWAETVIRVGNGSEGFDVSPDGREIWVANAQDGTISIVNRASRGVVATLPANVPGANRLKFTIDGRRVLVSTLGGPDVVVLDAGTRKEIARIPIGHGAAGIVMEPDGSRAFVACSPDNYVAVVDLASLKVTGRIVAGDEPDGLAWAVQPSGVPEQASDLGAAEFYKNSSLR